MVKIKYILVNPFKSVTKTYLQAKTEFLKKEKSMRF